MDLIPSFSVDHTKIVPGIFISRQDELGDKIITTYDVRVTRPNKEPAVDVAAMHTLEHLIATGRIELPPTFIENRPEDNAGRRIQPVDGLSEMFDKMILCRAAGIPLLFGQAGKSNRGQQRISEKGIGAGIDKILEYEDPKTVAVRIESKRFNADMLAQRVESKGFCCHDIGLITAVIRGRADPVRPVSLIQQGMKEEGLSVEKDSGNSGDGSALNCPDRGIGRNGIHAVRDGNRIQPGILRCPEAGIGNRAENLLFFCLKMEDAARRFDPDVCLQQLRASGNHSDPDS